MNDKPSTVAEAMADRSLKLRLTGKEEIADRISIQIPDYYKIMKKYAEKLV